MTFDILTVQDLYALPDPAWLVDGLVPEGELGWLVGPPGSYKSFQALSLGLAVATGTPFHYRDTRQGHVLYVCGEALRTQKNRVKAWEKEWGLTPGPFFHPVRFSGDLRGNAPVVVQAAHAAELTEVKLIIFDTQAACFPSLDENNNKEQNSLVAELKHIQSALGGPAILLIHHSPLSDATRMRGATGLLGAAHYVINGLRTAQLVSRLNVTKQRDAEHAEPIECEMRKVDLGDGVTSLVPVATPTTTPMRQEILDVLSGALRPLTDTDIWVGMDRGGAQPGAFRRCLKELHDEGMIGRISGKPRKWALLGPSLSTREREEGPRVGKDQ